MSALDADLVVLDLDNTLVRLDVDWPTVREELARLAGEAGGPASAPSIGALMDGENIPDSEAVREAMQRTLTEAELAGAGGPLNHALVDWLDGPAAGLPLAILSLNSHDSIERALSLCAMAERIQSVAGREDVERVKPDPDGMLMLAARHGVEPSRIVFVGDAETDRACAAAAGTQFIHVEEIGTRWA